MEDGQCQYWSRVARKYDYVVDLQIGGKTRSLIRERVAKEDGLGSLAEFGCGTGYHTEILSGRAKTVVATDLSPGMLAVARERITATNLIFQIEDCQKTSFLSETFDTAFMSLVIHFTEPGKTLAEMHRILKPGGTLIVVNLDPAALGPVDRFRCWSRIIFNGLAHFRVKPPKGFGQHMLTEAQLCARLRDGGFSVLSRATIRDGSRSSNIPVEYIRAVRT